MLNDQSDDEDHTFFSNRDEIVFQVSLKQSCIQELKFLLSLLRPIFKGYRDVIRCLNGFKPEDHIKISEVIDSCGCTKEQVGRIIDRLAYMTAIKVKGCGEFEEDYNGEKILTNVNNCIHVDVNSLDKILEEVQKFVLWYYYDEAYFIKEFNN